jgi:hypothetical protein
MTGSTIVTKTSFGQASNGRLSGKLSVFCCESMSTYWECFCLMLKDLDDLDGSLLNFQYVLASLRVDARTSPIIAVLTLLERW